MKLDDIDLEFSQQDQLHIQNHSNLEQAKKVGLECEDMGKGINFNLQQQSHKLSSSIMTNVRDINKNLGESTTLIDLIARERQKNRLMLWGVGCLIAFAAVIIVAMAFN